MLFIKVPNFPCGISAKIAEMRYNMENDILNKYEKKKSCLNPPNKIGKYLLNTTDKHAKKMLPPQ